MISKRMGLVAVAVAGIAGCGTSPEVVAIGGSSTVFPISEAVAEEFHARGDAPARVTVAVSGTGGGFKKFCNGELPVVGASRVVVEGELEACAKAGVPMIELPIAYDGIAVVVHPENDWVDSMTVEELRRLWEPGAQGKVLRWSDVRPSWPDEEIHLFGAGVDSGTYDYFTAAVVGRRHASRGDFTSSEDDNVLVQGVSTDRRALGFFGFAYYHENRSRLRALPIDDGDPANGEGAVAPSPETIETGTYQPLSRPLFLYVSRRAAEQPEVEGVVDFYLEQAGRLAAEVGYVSLGDEAYRMVRERFARRVTGSAYAGRDDILGVSVEDVLRGGGEGGS